MEDKKSAILLWITSVTLNGKWVMVHTFPVYIVVPIAGQQNKSGRQIAIGTYVYFNLLTIGIFDRGVVTLNPDILDELSCKIEYKHAAGQGGA